VRKGQFGQTGATDFGPGVEGFSGLCAEGKQRFTEALYKSAGRWQQIISRSREINPSRSVKTYKRTVRQPSKLQGTHNKSSRRKQIATLRRLGLGFQESPN